MSLPITALYAGIMMIFALVLSFYAGGLRGKSGISVLHGDPINMDTEGVFQGWISSFFMIWGPTIAERGDPPPS